VSFLYNELLSWSCNGPDISITIVRTLKLFSTCNSIYIPTYTIVSIGSMYFLTIYIDNCIFKQMEIVDRLYNLQDNALIIIYNVYCIAFCGRFRSANKSSLTDLLQSTMCNQSMRNIVIPSEITVTVSNCWRNHKTSPRSPFTTHESLPFVKVNKFATFNSIYCMYCRLNRWIELIITWYYSLVQYKTCLYLTTAGIYSTCIHNV
jgi:hypothetical protein